MTLPMLLLTASILGAAAFTAYHLSKKLYWHLRKTHMEKTADFIVNYAREHYGLRY